MEPHLDAFARASDASAAKVADLAERAIASGGLSGGRGGLSSPLFGAVELLILADRNEPARRVLDELIAHGRRRALGGPLAFGLGWRCLLLARTASLLEAEADLREHVELSLAQGWLEVAPMILGFGLDVLVDRGELDDAEELLERSGMAARPASNDLTIDPVIHARARMRAARGDLAAARADLVSLRRRDARWNTYPTLVPPILVDPALADDRDVARADAALMLSDADRWGTARARGVALRAAGLTEGGERGIELLHESVEVLDGSPARLELARSLADFGAALRRRGSRADARVPLRRALDLADACGARPLADRARQELRAAGGRPRRPRLSGVRSLTASERRIAGMAAEGLTNPEIAQSLFVTRKTVEAHLGSVYRKLGIRSRTQLAAALRDDQSQSAGGSG
jgi:DNA-binding CsgD family transcriptional regulator